LSAVRVDDAVHDPTHRANGAAFNDVPGPDDRKYIAGSDNICGSEGRNGDRIEEDVRADTDGLVVRAGGREGRVDDGRGEGEEDA
jgi:hypothetical protein